MTHDDVGFLESMDRWASAQQSAGWADVKRLIALVRSEAARADGDGDYQRIIKAVLACNPRPASESPDGQLEPPWHVIDRVRRERDEWKRAYGILCFQCEERGKEEANP